MGLSLQEQKELETHKGTWAIVANLQKVGYEIPTNVLRTLALVSGGGMVATLTFVGGLWTRNDDLGRQVAKAVSEGMFWFGAALAVCVVTSVVGWFAVYATAQTFASKFFLGKESVFRHVVFPLYFLIMGSTAIAASFFVYGMFLTFAGLKANF
jgi:hypothetical protein